MDTIIFKNKYTWMLKEQHQTNCECSYCSNKFDKPLHYGLNIPKDWKAANSWYIIKYGKGKYLRWTNSWIRLFKKK